MKGPEIARPLAAALLFVGLLAATAAAVGTGWADLSGAIEERDAQADLLARSVDVGRRARLNGSTPPAADPFIAADTDTQAAAKLDGLVRGAVAAAEGRLLSSRAEAKAPDPTRPDEAAIGTRVEVQAVIEGQNDALQAILLRLETGAPTVLVEALEIVPAESAGGDGEAPRLRMTLTLAAYRRGARS